MLLMNTRERYGLVAQLFHWVTASLILVLVPLGLVMVWLPVDTGGAVSLKVWLYSLHKTLGVTALAVALARIAWALVCVRPRPLHPERRAETLAADTVHWLLYAGIVLAPVTGLLHHYATIGFAPIWWPLPQDVPFVPKSEPLSIVFKWLHWGSALMIVVSLGAHIAGALKHLIVDRDETLARIVPGAKCDPQVTGHAHHRRAPALLATGIVAAMLSASAGYATVRNVQSPQSQALLAQAGTASGAGAARWAVDHDASRLGITVVQLGSPVDGAFGAWDADIVFDPDDPEGARVTALIDVASLTLGTVSGQAVGADFLDAPNHPRARFVAEGFKALDDTATAFEAEGTLTIRGVERPFLLPFDLAVDGDRAVMSATVTVNRIDFGVGAQSQPTEATVAFGVDVAIELAADRLSPTDGS